MGLYLLVVTAVCLHLTHGAVDYRESRPRRQATNGGHVFTCPAFFQNTYTNEMAQRQPPKFTECPPADLKEVYYVPEGAQSTAVSWTEPVAFDARGVQLSVQQIHGSLSGSTFSASVYGRHYDAVYLATDEEGLSESCHFSFKVTVHTCEQLQWPTNGNQVCSENNELGSICSYSCNDGYQLSGPSIVTCQNHTNPQWSQVPSCEKVTCVAPPSLPHGSAVCIGNDYRSLCTYSCDQGYSLQGSVFTKCEATGMWSADRNTKCLDITPPSIFCLSPQTFYAQRGVTTTSVTWNEPIATDNEDTTPIITWQSGPTQGVIIEAGNSKNVTYRAIDEEGNESPECTIELRVHAISCDHPSKTFLDSNLLFSCMLTNYTHGDQCNLTCKRNLPLEGSQVITCERNNTGPEPSGYWSVGSRSQPACTDILCPTLDPPRNGHFTYDSVLGKPTAQMHCSNSGGVNYDIPHMGTRFTGNYQCHSGIGWFPNYTRTPDCIVERKAIGFELDSEIFYFNGSCAQTNVSAVMAQLQEVLNNATSRFQAVCPSNTTCSASDLVVSCDVLTRKRRSESQRTHMINPSRLEEHAATMTHSIVKRQVSSSTLIVSFYINAYFDLSNMSASAIINYSDDIQLNKLKPIIDSMVDEGSFFVPNWTLRNDSFQTTEYGDAVCSPGYLHDSNFVCKPCPAGYYIDDDKCVSCSLGYYAQSGSSVCTPCPNGFSTKQTGSDSIINCSEYCSPGFYSPDGLEPCVPCPTGHYNPESRATSCVVCPSYQLTVWSGSVTAADCQDFDVQLDILDTFVDVAAIGLQTNFTVSVWVKKLTDRTLNAELKIRADSTDILAINFSDKVHVSSVLFGLDSELGKASSEVWAHVTATVDLRGRQVSAYFNGEQKAAADNIQAADVSFSIARVSVASSGDTGIQISGLRLYNGFVSQSDVDTAVTTCNLLKSDDLMHMGDFRNIKRQGIKLVTPSTCNVTDNCHDNPCGSHMCINRDGGFICICNNNWSGPTCTIPPDFCQDNLCENGANCVTTETNYSCVCQQGYKGPFCEISPVAGMWSPWSQWTECSATCDTGTRERTRACDSPVPEDLGQNCARDSRQTEMCNTSPCPECPDSVLDAREDVQCSADTGDGLHCRVECQDGYIFPDNLSSYRFRCGMVTGYRWLPMQNVPVCKEPIVPQSMSLTTSVKYVPSVSNADEQKFLDALKTQLPQTDCHGNSLCTMQVNAVYGQLQTIFSTVELYIEASLSSTEMINYKQYLLNGTVSRGLQEVMNSSSFLESTAALINDSADAILDVTMDGIVYAAEPMTLPAHGTVSCSQGQGSSQCFCGACPAGTFLNGSVCSFCGKGSYQPEDSQLQCLQCSYQYTTVTSGSQGPADCLVLTGRTTGKYTTTASSSTSESGRTNTAEVTTEGGTTSKDDVGIYIYTGVAVVGVAIMISVAMVLICRRKCPSQDKDNYTGMDNGHAITDISANEISRNSSEYADIEDTALDHYNTPDVDHYNTPDVDHYNMPGDTDPYNMPGYKGHYNTPGDMDERSVDCLNKSENSAFSNANYLVRPENDQHLSISTRIEKKKVKGKQRPLPDMPLNLNILNSGSKQESDEPYLSPVYKLENENRTGYMCMRGGVDGKSEEEYLMPVNLRSHNTVGSDSLMPVGSDEYILPSIANTSVDASALPENKYLTENVLQTIQATDTSNGDSDYLTKVIMHEEQKH